ncbi:MAG: type II toxin-antitoxin system HicB family antitoxin [Pirellulales bacterium]
MAQPFRSGRFVAPRVRKFMAESMRLPIRIVFYKEGNAWVAHCLEFDLMGDGDTREEALDQLGDAIALQIEASIEHDNPANLFSPADGKFFEMFAAGKNIAIGELQLKEVSAPRHIDSFEIEECQYREYAGGSTCAV